MAITATSCELMRSLRVKRGSSLLEIGEANWYGDIDPQSMGLQRQENWFDIAKEFYQTWFAPSRTVAIDRNGSEDAIRADLNYPFEFGDSFDVVINNGTAEHIFDVARIFVLMHDCCELNGWMIHDAPFFGWIDHGFYNLNPTLFFDVALANCYEVSLMAVHEIKSKTIIRLNGRDHVSELVEAGKLPMNSALFVALRKRVDQPFVIPTQGYYSRSLSEQGTRAWEALR